MNESQLLAKKLNFLPKIYRKVVYQQFLASLVVGILAGFIFNVHVSLSVLLGALPVIIGTVVATPIANLKKNKRSPGSIVISALKAEAVKIAVIFIALWLVYKFYVQLVPIALVIGLIMSVLISCLAISDIDNINIETKE
jgi:ATP synthase protein I|tara:strand:- start:263 stop:682 length:420 start_codon:yes stop_codon:yes gene_type:complete